MNMMGQKASEMSCSILHATSVITDLSKQSTVAMATRMLNLP